MGFVVVGSLEVEKAHDGKMWTDRKVADEVLDSLEHWCGWSSSISE